MPTFAVIDAATDNVLGEFASRSEAEDFRSRLLDADGSAAARLRVEVDDEADAPPSSHAASGHG